MEVSPVKISVQWDATSKKESRKDTSVENFKESLFYVVSVKGRPKGKHNNL